MTANTVDIHRSLQRHRLISLVGGGGKTTLMFRLARELRAMGKRVVTTTTTRIQPPREDQTGALLCAQGARPDLLATLQGALETHGHVTLVQQRLVPEEKMEEKLAGIGRDLVDAILDSGLCDHLIVEADGAARRPFKAPAAHEPVLPACSDLIIALVGLDVVGRPLAPAYVHRLRQVAQITGLVPGQTIRPADVAAVITHPQGLMKDVPPEAESWIFLNKSDQPGNPARARQIAEILACRNRRHPQWLIIGAAARKKWIDETHRLAPQPGAKAGDLG